MTTYFNPMICTDHPRYREAADKGVLTMDALGRPYEYRYTGSAQFFVGQIDPTDPGAAAFYASLLDEAVRDGYDGWMEDFGEYTPAGRARRGRLDRRGRAQPLRRRLPRARARVLAGRRAGPWPASTAPAGPAPRRRARSSGAATRRPRGTSTACESTVRNGLTMGLSGVSLWGSDIGGFFALSEPQTTPELLVRWLQVGFASGVMRTQANGFALTSSPRAQIFDKEILPVWARYARLRTQLYPYLSAAEAEYDRTGMPLMRHLALAYPDDARATARDDEYLLGDDLLVAPVMEPGARKRSAYLPAGAGSTGGGRSALDDAGAPHLKTARVLDGAGSAELDAPLDELPLLVRAGTVLPLLDPSVQTLADYGEGKAVRLRDRANLMRLLAWPRGWRRTAISDDARESVVSAEARRGWILKLRGIAHPHVHRRGRPLDARARRVQALSRARRQAREVVLRPGDEGPQAEVPRAQPAGAGVAALLIPR